MMKPPPKMMAPPPTLKPPPKMMEPPQVGGLKVGDFKYTVNGVRRTVKRVNDEIFELAEVPFARFNKKTGECDRYTGMCMYDAPQPMGDDVATLMLDLASLLRHGKEWAARQMFGNESFRYGKTPLEAAQKAVRDARRSSGVE